MPEMWPPHTAWPASLPAARMPVMSFLVFLSSFSYCGGEGGDGDVAKVVRVIVCEGEGEGQTVRRFAGAAGRGGV